MEYQKITNLLDHIPDKVPRFITKKWIEVHDQYFTDAYIVVKGIVTVSADERDRDEMNR